MVGETSGLYYKVISVLNNSCDLLITSIFSLATDWKSISMLSGESRLIQKKLLHVLQVSGNLWPMSSMTCMTHHVQLLLHQFLPKPQSLTLLKRSSSISNEGHLPQPWIPNTPLAHNFTMQQTPHTPNPYPPCQHKHSLQPPPQALKYSTHQQLRLTKSSKSWLERVWQIPWQITDLQKRQETAALVSSVRSWCAPVARQSKTVGIRAETAGKRLVVEKSHWRCVIWRGTDHTGLSDKY
jgi:hypothetical protein